MKKYEINIRLCPEVRAVDYLRDPQKIKITTRDKVLDITEKKEYDFCVFAIPDHLKLIENPTYYQ